jgi:hypothetical protein
MVVYGREVAVRILHVSCFTFEIYGNLPYPTYPVEMHNTPEVLFLSYFDDGID